MFIWIHKNEGKMQGVALYQRQGRDVKALFAKCGVVWLAILDDFWMITLMTGKIICSASNNKLHGVHNPMQKEVKLLHCFLYHQWQRRHCLRGLPNCADIPNIKWVY